MTPRIEWLNLETGEIFESVYLEAMFFGMVVGIDWKRVAIVGVKP